MFAKGSWKSNDFGFLAAEAEAEASAIVEQEPVVESGSWLWTSSLMGVVGRRFPPTFPFFVPLEPGIGAAAAGGGAEAAGVAWSSSWDFLSFTTTALSGSCLSLC